HGLIGLARAVAQDAGPFGVTSNAVLPGWVRTAMAERSAKTEAERRGISVEQVWRERAAIYPQNRVLEPREVAQVIAFLCSDAAGGVNGAAITVSLGGSARRSSGAALRRLRCGPGVLGLAVENLIRLGVLEGPVAACDLGLELTRSPARV